MLVEPRGSQASRNVGGSQRRNRRARLHVQEEKVPSVITDARYCLQRRRRAFLDGAALAARLSLRLRGGRGKRSAGGGAWGDELDEGTLGGRVRFGLGRRTVTEIVWERRCEAEARRGGLSDECGDNQLQL